MKKLAFILILAIVSVGFIGCDKSSKGSKKAGSTKSKVDSAKSKKADSKKAEKSISKDSQKTTHTATKNQGFYLPECKGYKNKIKGCAERWYYDNKKLKWEIPYKNDKINGMWKEYNENGSLRFSIMYKNDKPISGKCGNGKVIDFKKLRNFDETYWDITKITCD